MNKQQERMPAFPQAVIDFWHTSFFRGVTFYSNEIFSIIINPELSEVLKLERSSISRKLKKENCLRLIWRVIYAA